MNEQREDEFTIDESKVKDALVAIAQQFKSLSEFIQSLQLLLLQRRFLFLCSKKHVVFNTILFFGFDTQITPNYFINHKND